MIIRKLLIIIFGIFLVLTAGVCNLYPIYLSKMQKKFNYSLKEVNLYGTFINIGLWVAFPMGYIYDKLGPKLSCLIGALFLSGGYLSLYFIFSSEITQMSLFILLLIGLIMGQGSALCYTTSVTTNLKNFRFKESSSIVGLLIANLALSPSIFTTYKNAFDIKTSSFFLAIAIFSFFVIIFSGFVFHNIRRIYSQEETQQTYEKYKEKKIIKILIIINIVTLIVYTFSVIYNHMQEDRIPLVIIYPCLQSLNFIVIVLEQAKVFDKIYFESYITKQLMKSTSEPLRENKSINICSREYDENLKKNSYIIGLSNRENSNILNDLSKESRKTNSIIEKTTDIKVENSEENYQKDSTEDIKNECTEIVLENNLKEIKNFNSIQKNYNDETQMDETDQNKTNINFKVLNKNSESVNKKKIIKIQDEIVEKDSPFKDPEIRFYDTNFQNPNMILNLNISNIKNSDPNIPVLIDNENDSMTLKSAVYTKEFLFLILILIFGIGSVIANLNNISYIYESITQTPNGNSKDSNNTLMSDISQYVILYFVFNSFTRIISGLILDFLIKKKKFMFFLIFISLLGLLSQFLGLFMNKILLFVSICFAGMTHGGYMTFTPIYVRNEYGLKNMGKILGLLTSGCAIGSFFIADFVFIIFYEWQILKNIELDNKNVNISTNEIDKKCYGENCFRLAYLITTLLFLVNVILSYNIYKRYNKKNKITE